jgi:hypothetical protein
VSSGNLILRLDFSSTRFQSDFRSLKPDIMKEARRLLSDLIMVDIENPPARLHLHPLKDKLVPSVLDPTKKVKVYTLHITSNDSWKASFTLEAGTAYMRLCGPHDKVDKSP